MKLSKQDLKIIDLAIKFLEDLDEDFSCLALESAYETVTGKDTGYRRLSIKYGKFFARSHYWGFSGLYDRGRRERILALTTFAHFGGVYGKLD